MDDTHAARSAFLVIDTSNQQKEDTTGLLPSHGAASVINLNRIVAKPLVEETSGRISGNSELKMGGVDEILAVHPNDILKLLIANDMGWIKIDEQARKDYLENAELLHNRINVLLDNYTDPKKLTDLYHELEWLQRGLKNYQTVDAAKFQGLSSSELLFIVDDTKINLFSGHDNARNDKHLTFADFSDLADSDNEKLSQFKDIITQVEYYLASAAYNVQKQDKYGILSTSNSLPTIEEFSAKLWGNDKFLETHFPGANTADYIALYDLNDFAALLHAIEDASHENLFVEIKHNFRVRTSDIKACQNAVETIPHSAKSMFYKVKRNDLPETITVLAQMFTLATIKGEATNKTNTQTVAANAEGETLYDLTKQRYTEDHITGRSKILQHILEQLNLKPALAKDYTPTQRNTHIAMVLAQPFETLSRREQLRLIDRLAESGNDIRGLRFFTYADILKPEVFQEFMGYKVRVLDAPTEDQKNTATALTLAMQIHTDVSTPDERVAVDVVCGNAFIKTLIDELVALGKIKNASEHIHVNSRDEAIKALQEAIANAPNSLQLLTYKDNGVRKIGLRPCSSSINNAQSIPGVTFFGAAARIAPQAHIDLVRATQAALCSDTEVALTSDERAAVLARLKSLGLDASHCANLTEDGFKQLLAPIIIREGGGAAGKGGSNVMSAFGEVAYVVKDDQGEVHLLLSNGITTPALLQTEGKGGQRDRRQLHTEFATDIVTRTLRGIPDDTSVIFFAPGGQGTLLELMLSLLHGHKDKIRFLFPEGEKVEQEFQDVWAAFTGEESIPEEIIIREPDTSKIRASIEPLLRTDLHFIATYAKAQCFSLGR